MSVRLEQNGVYVLPHARGTDYLLVRAEQHSDGWRLVETHDAPGGSEHFQARAGLRPEDQCVFGVTSSGEIEQLAPRAVRHPDPIPA